MHYICRRMHVYRDNTTRVDVHICGHMEKGGVCGFMTRTHSPTIELYIPIS